MLSICKVSCLRFRQLRSTKKVIVECKYSQRFVSTEPGDVPYIRDHRPHLDIATFGHCGHGKTTLASAMTKVLSESSGNSTKFMRPDDFDNTAGEKQLGHGIQPTKVDFYTSEYHYGFADLPGHQDYTKHTIASVSRLDCGLLVVSATDGICAQSMEHLAIIQALGVKQAVVFVNKLDLPTANECATLVEMDMQEELLRHGFSAATPIISGSALAALNGTNTEIGHNAVAQLLEKIDSHFTVPPRLRDAPFLLSIDKCFQIPGQGSVAVGRMLRGKVKKGDAVDLFGNGNHLLNLAVKEVQVYRKSTDFAEAGESCVSCLLRGVKTGEVDRGMVLVPRGYAATQTDQFEATLEFLDSRGRSWSKSVLEDADSRRRFHVHSLAWNSEGTILTDESETDNWRKKKSSVCMYLRKPQFLELGQKYFLRSETTTLATGTITKLLPQLSPGEKKNLDTAYHKLTKKAY